MPTKERLKLKDLKLGYFKEYFAPLFNLFKPKKKISKLADLKDLFKKICLDNSNDTLWLFKNQNGSKIYS